MISGGLEPSSQFKLQELERILRDLDDPVFRARILAELRVPAEVVANQMRNAVRALPAPAPSDWKQAGADGLRVDVQLSGPQPQIAVVLPRTRTNRGPWLLDHGSWRHPLFGNRSRWFEQRVTPGWFDETGRAAHPGFTLAAERGLEAAAEQVADRIELLNRI